MRGLLCFIVQEIEHSSFCLLTIRDQMTVKSIHSMRLLQEEDGKKNTGAAQLANNNNVTYIKIKSILFERKSAVEE